MFDIYRLTKANHETAAFIGVPANSNDWPIDPRDDAGREKISSARPTEIAMYASSPLGCPMANDVAGIGRRPWLPGSSGFSSTASLSVRTHISKNAIKC